MRKPFAERTRFFYAQLFRMNRLNFFNGDLFAYDLRSELLQFELYVLNSYARIPKLLQYYSTIRLVQYFF